MPRLVVTDTISLTADAATGDSSTANGGAPSGDQKLTVTLTARMFTQAVPESAPAPAASAAGDSTTPTTSATTNVAEG
jgi:hypothetical protein